mgnify:CR=1 FL=1
MAILKIVTKKEDEALLRKVSRPVTEITPRIHTLLDDMTVPQLSEILGVPVFPSANDGVGFIESVLGVKLCD